MTPSTRAEQARLLRQRVEESGLSGVQFAERVLLRDRRTVQRWIAGESPIPAVVLDWLADPWRSPYP